MAGPLPPVPGVFKLRFFYDLHGFGGTNILHFSYTGGPPDAATCASFATDGQVAWGSTISTNFDPHVALVGTDVTDLSSDTGASGQDLTTHAGTDGSGPMMCQIATVTKYPVSLRYRGGHPKTFWPPMAYGNTADWSNWTSGAAGSFGLGVGSLIAGVVGKTHGSTTCTGHVAVSYFLAHTPRLVPLVLNLGSPICDTRFGSMRRRRNQPVTI